MLDYLFGLLFLLLIVGATAGINALFGLIGWTSELARLAAFVCAVALIVGGLALANHVNETVKASRERDE